MTSKNTDNQNELEWTTVRDLLRRFHLKPSVLGNIFEAIKDIPQVPKDEKI